MITAGQPLDLIQARLQQARRIWRTSETLARGLVWLGGLLGALLALGALDNVFDLPGALRLILSLALIGGALAGLFAWALRPLFWRINDQAAAVYLERKTGERDNLLINAVQFGASVSEPRALASGSNRSLTVAARKSNDARSTSFSGSAQMVEQVIASAAARAAELSTKLVWDKKRLRKLGLAACTALALVLLYVLLMFQYAEHAFLRYTSPLSDLPPLSQTRLSMFPDADTDVLSGDALAVHGLAWAEKGTAPAEAFLIIAVDGGTRRIPMEREPKPCAELAAHSGSGKNALATAFVYELPNITKPFAFYLLSGDGRSKRCAVRVRERAGIEDQHLELKFPAYTGVPPARQALPNGLIHALVGSQATLVFTPTKDLASAALNFQEGHAAAKRRGEKAWEASFTVDKEGPYTLSLHAADGVETKNALEGQILPQADALPTAAFDAPALNISAAPGASVPLAVKAQDDFGLKEVRVLCHKQARGEAEEKEADFAVIAVWQYPVPGKKNATELHPLALDPARFATGEAYAFYAEASDHCPKGIRAVRSAPLVIHVLTPEQMAPSAGGALETVFKRIQELINLETKARAKTSTVKENLEVNLAKRLELVQSAQGEANTAAQRLAKDLDSMKKEKGKESAAEILFGLRSIIDDLMAPALAKIGEIKTVAQAPSPVKDRTAEGGCATKLAALLAAEEELQGEIITRLTALLGNVSTLSKEKKTENAAAAGADDQENQRLREKLEETKDKLEKFINAEKKVLQSTEELEKKKPVDLTEEDLKKAGDLAKEEQNWAKFFREKFTDLSKVADQDFSNSKLADELNQVYQEIQKAAEALQGKNMEVAVRVEESGLELAKKLETNLEKWLPDTSNNIKWNMEEPQGQFDVPLADLPAELEDIIGELIDKEEDMADDNQSVTSSWLDSIDKGVGWDAMDGPISDNSAKGVTGNRLPNQQEIAGRSGEGRNGKSLGQFVSKTADGKGGPQTPSRTTNDPYEDGQVDDKSKDPVGGSTGGGKNAGGAAGGLRGTPPPATAAKMERLKETQAQLRQQAEKVTTKLHAYHLPSGDMEEAVRRMNAIENGLQNAVQNGRGFNLRQAHSSVLDSLKQEKSVMEFQAKINRERSRELPEKVRHDILSGMQQKAPAGYQDLLEAYYKALVEKDGSNK